MSLFPLNSRRSNRRLRTHTAPAATIDVSIQAAAYRGLFNLSSIPLFNCTANCTWPGSYYSLGFSSACLDVTEKTLQASNITFGPKEYGGNVTTPGGIRLDMTYSPTSFQPVVIINTTRLIDSIGEDIVDRPRRNFARRHRITPDIARIAIFRVPRDPTDSQISRDKMEIIECDFSLVAYRYSDIKVKDNTFAIGTQEVTRLEPGVVLNDPDVHDSESPKYDPYATTHYNATFTLSGMPNMTVAVADLAGILTFFRSNRFSGTIYSGESPPRGGSQGIGDAFRTGNNISAAFDDMARSMTDYLRSGYDVEAAGISVYQLIHVDVRWFWLVPTLVTQVISVVFFFVVVAKSSLAQGLHLWKDSTIAVLTQELRTREDAAGEGYIVGPQVAKVKELEEWGKTVKARLV